jgi:hypothetical protein
MANIKVNDIKPAGTELFDDSESFMNNLSDSEINNILGGGLLRFSRREVETSIFMCCFVNRDN